MSIFVDLIELINVQNVFTNCNLIKHNGKTTRILVIRDEKRYGTGCEPDVPLTSVLVCSSEKFGLSVNWLK